MRTIIALALAAVTSCAHPDAIVERTFSPTQGGVVRFELAEKSGHIDGYVKHSESAMQKFCDGPFELTSVKDVPEVSSTTFFGLTWWNNYTYYRYLSFTCKQQPAKAEVKQE